MAMRAAMQPTPPTAAMPPTTTHRMMSIMADPFLDAATSLPAAGATVVRVSFPAETVAAVLHHMNDDHRDDNVTIVRGHVEPDAVTATMTGFDGTSGTWSYTVGDELLTATIPWGITITERHEIRREIVELYDVAAEKLGLPPRSH